MDARLAWLHLRRGARPWLLVAVAALVTLALLRDDGAESLAAGGRWTRRDVWAAGLLVLWPAALVRAASLAASWRDGELDWIAPRARRLGGALVASWTGVVGAALAVALCVGAVAELAGGAPPEVVDRGWIDGEREARDDADSFAFTVAAPATGEGAWLVVPVELRGHRGPGVDVRVTVERGDARSAWSTRLARAGELLVALPAGAAPARVAIAATSNGAALFVPRVGARVLDPAGPLRAAWSLYARVALAAALSTALALALGAWISAPGACLGAATPWLVAWLGDAAWPLPARDLFAALDETVRGRAAAAPDAAAVAVAVAGCVAALALARAGLARRGRGA